MCTQCCPLQRKGHKTKQDTHTIKLQREKQVRDTRTSVHTCTCVAASRMLPRLNLSPYIRCKQTYLVYPPPSALRMLNSWRSALRPLQKGMGSWCEHVTSRHVTSRHVTSRHVTSRHVTSRHVMSRHVTSRHSTEFTPTASG